MGGDSVRTALLAALRRHPAGLPYRHLQRELKCGAETLDIALSVLMRSLDVVRVEGRFFAPRRETPAEAVQRMMEKPLTGLAAQGSGEPVRATVEAQALSGTGTTSLGPQRPTLTARPRGKAVAGQVECTSCHRHVLARAIDAQGLCMGCRSAKAAA